MSSLKKVPDPFSSSPPRPAEKDGAQGMSSLKKVPDPFSSQGMSSLKKVPDPNGTDKVGRHYEIRA
jgi:hypothetical protein